MSNNKNGDNKSKDLYNVISVDGIKVGSRKPEVGSQFMTVIFVY